MANDWGILAKIVRIGSNNAANMAKKLRNLFQPHDYLTVEDLNE